MHLLNKCETGDKCRGCSIASLREGGGPRSGGRSLRDFEFNLTSLLRALPQSPSAPAPSRREPFFSHSSAYINKIPTNRLIGLWELFVDAFSPLRTTDKYAETFLQKGVFCIVAQNKSCSFRQMVQMIKPSQHIITFPSGDGKLCASFIFQKWNWWNRFNWRERQAAPLPCKIIFGLQK